MNLTEEEEQDFLFMFHWEGEDYELKKEDMKKVLAWLEQKKKQWREVVFMEVKDWALKQPDEGGTSFYDYHKALLRFLDDKVLKSIKPEGKEWRWKCAKCGIEKGLYDAHYGTINGYICEICRLNIKANGSLI